MPAAPKPADMTDLVELKQLPARRSKAALALGAFDLKLVDVHLDLPLTRCQNRLRGRGEKKGRLEDGHSRSVSNRRTRRRSSEATMTSGGTVVGYATAHRSKPRAIYHPL